MEGRRERETMEERRKRERLWRAGERETMEGRRERERLWRAGGREGEGEKDRGIQRWS
jgi:hypothetical protein